MIQIFSPSNSKIQFVRKLGDKRFRNETKLFFIEGERNVFDILKIVKNEDVHSIYITDKFLNESLLTTFNDKLILTNEICFQRMSATKTAQGILAVLNQPQFETSFCDRLLLLDGITDSGNLGTIIRTCAATGYGVILKDCVDLFSPKVVRSTMSAILKVKIFNFDDKTLSILKSQGIKLIAGDMEGKNIFTLDNKPKKVCIVIGNEAFGISETVMEKCDEKVSIPMENMESLNAAVSAAILMYIFKY